MNNSWIKFVSESKHYPKMKEFVDSSDDICPIASKVFRFFDTDICNAKCIILGMDPYPSTYFNNGKFIPVATGRSFEVANVEFWTDKYKQLSLSMIFKTLWNYKFSEILSMDVIRQEIDRNIKSVKLLNIHDWFDEMEKQGVIFLNATLTTKIGTSDSHTEIWKDFMNELIRYIVNLNPDIKWLIWGQNAKNRVESLVPKEKIIYTCHPATRVNNTFIKDCVFRKVEDVKWF